MLWWIFNHGLVTNSGRIVQKNVVIPLKAAASDRERLLFLILEKYLHAER